MERRIDFTNIMSDMRMKKRKANEDNNNNNPEASVVIAVEKFKQLPTQPVVADVDILELESKILFALVAYIHDRIYLRRKPRNCYRIR